MDEHLRDTDRRRKRREKREIFKIDGVFNSVERAIHLTIDESQDQNVGHGSTDPLLRLETPSLRTSAARCGTLFSFVLHQLRKSTLTNHLYIISHLYEANYLFNFMTGLLSFFIIQYVTCFLLMTFDCAMQYNICDSCRISATKFCQMTCTFSNWSGLNSPIKNILMDPYH